MVLGHTIGMACGAIAAALGAFLVADPTPGSPEVTQALAGLLAALAALSTYLQYTYPSGSAIVAPSPPQ